MENEEKAEEEKCKLLANEHLLASDGFILVTHSGEEEPFAIMFQQGRASLDESIDMVNASIEQLINIRVELEISKEIDTDEE